MTHVFVSAFRGKHTSWIWVFLAMLKDLGQNPKGAVITSLLADCSFTSRSKLYFQIFFVMIFLLSPLLLLREP